MSEGDGLKFLLTRTVSIVVLAAAQCAVGQSGSFEGVMKMTLQAQGQTVPFTYAVKGHKVRMEMQSAARTNVILIDLDAHTQTILVPELNAYAVHTGDTPSGVAQGAPPKITDLGTSETIAGHKCENYSMESDKYSGTFCMTKEFGANPFGNALGGPALRSLEDLQKAGMPLKVSLIPHGNDSGTNAGGKTEMEVTQIIPGPVDDAQFTVPEGWHAMQDLPKMH